MKRLFLGLLLVSLTLSVISASGTEELFSSGSAEQIVSSLRYGGRGPGSESPLFQIAMHNPDPTVLPTLISLGYDPFERGKDGITLLMAAAKETTNPEIITGLLDAGLDVDDKDDFGWTALFFALKYNDNPSIAKTLLDNGASYDLRDDFSYSPLYMAMVYGQRPEKIRVLVEAGLDLEQRDDDDRTALMIASAELADPTSIENLIQSKQCGTCYPSYMHFGGGRDKKGIIYLGMVSQEEEGLLHVRENIHTFSLDGIGPEQIAPIGRSGDPYE